MITRFCVGLKLVNGIAGLMAHGSRNPKYHFVDGADAGGLISGFILVVELTHIKLLEIGSRRVLKHLFRFRTLV